MLFIFPQLRYSSAKTGELKYGIVYLKINTNRINL